VLTKRPRGRTHSREKRESRAPRVSTVPLDPRLRGDDDKNTSSRAFRVAGPKAFAEAGITHNDVDHLMIYDAPCSLPGASFAHLPIYGLEDLGFVPRGEAGAFIAEHNTAPGGRLPLNTNGGGLSYMHSGMYGMYALQESVRQMRGTAPAQIPDARISVCHDVGGMFAASGTIITSNEPP
jgi:acetyl-CoA acetyltransferase